MNIEKYVEIITAEVLDCWSRIEQHLNLLVGKNDTKDNHGEIVTLWD